MPEQKYELKHEKEFCEQNNLKQFYYDKENQDECIDVHELLHEYRQYMERKS